MGMLQNGVQWALSKLNEEESEEVRYVQNGLSFTMNMVPALETDEHTTDLGTVTINSRRQDFLALKSDFDNLSLQMPDRGDMIYRIVAGEEIEYQVTSDGSEACWRPQSRYRLGMRIHTIRTAINVSGS